MSVDEAPIVLRDPPPPRPRFLELRLAWAEFVEFWSLYSSRHQRAVYRASTLRWTRNNYDQPRTCQCGQPGTVRVMSPPSPTGHNGAMPPWWWRCDGHSSVPLTVPWFGGRPLTGQTVEGCSWRNSRIDTGLVTACGCGHHVGQKDGADPW